MSMPEEWAVPLVVVTGFGVELPATVTDPRCGTLIVPLTVVTVRDVPLPPIITDPRGGKLIVPTAVLTEWRS
jgi:hypothetical protein